MRLVYYTQDASMDLSKWLTRQQVAQRLGLSAKSIQRMAEKGILKQRLREGNVGGPQAVYDPVAVAELVAKRGVGIEPEPEMAELGLQEKIWLTIPEAALLLNMPVSYVRLWTRLGQLPAIKLRRTWRIRREDLYFWRPPCDDNLVVITEPALLPAAPLLER